MKRREFHKAGTLFFTAVGAGRLGFSFVPGESFDDGPYKNTIAFRKPPRIIKEEEDGFLWADAADFQNYGGWALDTQFAGFMGSSYLIAHGTGTPVNDAVLEIPDVTAGRYRIWVRSKNWIPEYSPGRFTLSVNGQDCESQFGVQSSAGWSWEDGGEHQLPEGKTVLFLKDLTGYYGRCSSVILTRDLKYKPPAGLEAFRRERARLSGVSDVPESAGKYDVVVVGAGTAGCCAAIASARMGAKTVLISDRPVVGGNASIELGVPVQGAAKFHEHAREGGIIEEAGRMAAVKDSVILTRPFADLIAAEPGLTVVENMFLEGVEKDRGGKIKAALARDTLTGARRQFAGKIFVDTTGDSWLGYHAGAEHRLGREARDEYSESLAPDIADNITMSGCLRGPHESFQRCIFYRTVKTGAPQSYTAPEWVYDLPEFPVFSHGRGHPDKLESFAKNGIWWIEYPGTTDDLNDPEGARDELLRINFSFWNHMKNIWPERGRLAEFRLDYVPFSNAKRETRRLIGDYVLNQNDCVADRHFEDAIGHAGWMLDIHATKGIFSTTGPFDSHQKIPVCEIPYRCLYSRNIENLMMAGRNISVTHYALGTVRVQGQTSLTGQAAGTAAALACLNGTTPRAIYEKHIGQLQQTLLKEDQFIPKVLNCDSQDLARTASVRASGSAPNCAPENVINGIARPWPGESNIWRSAAGEALPQWIELTLQEPAEISMVQCAFDTDLSVPLPNQRCSCPKGCVRNYFIEVYADGQWKTVARETGNFQRFRRHSFSPVIAEKVRLVAESVQDVSQAIVHEIRIYKNNRPAVLWEEPI
ncbi:FAD-dependent oxidoreductase [Tichowtungia aerotolerans]|uniref:FAD-dependent oxidoreductase n=1 Tax=Tichowtungia aerotolerans TaxID=2697043 RepID=A0A6P1M7D1_9BACT|nr:FAD-dependent oxidoreductase [Tichowtungia aerotolerans]QHI69942.1 FAD-dependent oxidoreductase [Tichowtungia aerotolerans]